MCKLFNLHTCPWNRETFVHNKNSTKQNCSVKKSKKKKKNSWTFSLCKNFKKKKGKLLSRFRVMKLLVPRCPIWLEQDFFSKTIHKPCFFHSYLSTFKKWKFHINKFMKFWQLKSTKLWWPNFRPKKPVFLLLLVVFFQRKFFLKTWSLSRKTV